MVNLENDGDSEHADSLVSKRKKNDCVTYGLQRCLCYRLRSLTVVRATRITNPSSSDKLAAPGLSFLLVEQRRSAVVCNFHQVCSHHSMWIKANMQVYHVILLSYFFSAFPLLFTRPLLSS